MSEDPKGPVDPLKRSIEGLKAFLREEGDLTDETIERETPDSVVSSFSGAKASEAVDMARKGLASEPDNPRLRDWLAFNLYAANQVDEAIVLYRQLLAENPGNVEQHYYLGNCCYKKGDFMSALAEWKKVLELAPDSSRGQKALRRIEKVRRHLYEVERRGRPEGV